MEGTAAALANLDAVNGAVDISAGSQGLIDNVASITVKIVSEQIKFITDRNDEMVYGNREKSETIKDKWVFERDISTNNPNWKLVETDIAYD